MSSWYPLAGGALLVLGVAVALFFSLDSPHSGLRKAVTRHIAELDKELRFLLWKTSGKRIAQGQLVCAFGVVLLSIWDLRALVLLALVYLGPSYWMRRARRQRVQKIEEQLDGWLLMLANMLKATGSLGEAIRATGDLAHGPIGEEIDLVLKEIRLGATTEQALSAMATRINSRLVTSHIATLLVGRTTGGELPALLEQSAASLREMARLEGVVRTQTAQGKAQLMVLVGAPMLIVAAFRMVEPNFFDPLFDSPIGNVVAITAVALWIGALVWARKVLDVDL